MLFPDIDTPALVIEKSIMDNNLATMQGIADKLKVKLRPHIKTHKTPELAKKQIELGAVGIAVAKLGEAEIMADNGIKNVQIANIIVGEHKIRRLIDLHKRLDFVSCCVDSIENVHMIDKLFSEKDRIIDLYLEIDVGFGRSGIKDFDKALWLAKEISQMKGVRLKGILTHAGQAYSASSQEEIKEIGLVEGTIMVNLAKFLKSNGIVIEEISVGSTPTAEYSAGVNGVTEIRPGNYIFHDMIQVSLGVTDISNCALSVISTVISKPSDERVIIDAGSKSLGLDKGAHGNEKLTGHGFIINKNAVIGRLSEEHGFVFHTNEHFSIGERIRIIPNHACAIMNLYDYVFLVDNNKIIAEYKIAARGKIT